MTGRPSGGMKSEVKPLGEPASPTTAKCCSSTIVAVALPDSDHLPDSPNSWTCRVWVPWARSWAGIYLDAVISRAPWSRLSAFSLYRNFPVPPPPEVQDQVGLAFMVGEEGVTETSGADGRADSFSESVVQEASHNDMAAMPSRA